MKEPKLNKTFLHRLFLLFVILVLPIFLVKEYRIILAKKDTKVLPAPDFFQATLQENNNKSFVFIVLTNNSINSIEENFDSILGQRYQNFRVIYIDYESQDGTQDRIEELIEEKHVKDRFKLIKTQKDYEAFNAYAEMIWACKNDEVIVHLSGNDWLANEEVLDRLDKVYTNPDVWMTYGQYVDYYKFKKGIVEPKPNKTLFKKRVQRAPWMLASLKTFYAGHFKEIRSEEVIKNMARSVDSVEALHLPLVEMGKAHVQFIPDILYIHHEFGQKKKGKMKLTFMNESLKNPVESAFSQNVCEALADVIIFSHTPEQLETCLSSIREHVKEVADISVIYKSKNQSDYDSIISENEDIVFILDESDFKSSFLTALIETKSSSYVILTSDQTIVQEGIALKPCIEAMRKTRALGFCFHLDKSKSKTRGIYAWPVKREGDNWDILKMALYRKIDIERDLKGKSFQTLNELAELWSNNLSSSAVGLSFDHSFTVEIN